MLKCKKGKLDSTQPNFEMQIYFLLSQNMFDEIQLTKSTPETLSTFSTAASATPATRSTAATTTAAIRSTAVTTTAAISSTLTTTTSTATTAATTLETIADNFWMSQETENHPNTTPPVLKNF